MSNKNQEFQAVLLFIAALLIGLLIVVLAGCDELIKQEPFYEMTTPQNEHKMHDLTHPNHEYKIENVA
jgi:hypothetical protein